MARYDCVVVGGGSAGCVAAGELARDPRRRVLLLECGGRAEDNPETLRADGYKHAFANDRVIWDRLSTPQPGAKRNRLFMGSGTGMGGSGSVNGMVYTRGAAADYDEWPEGWRWRDVAPDFAAIERTLRVRRREPTRFTEACVRATEQTGFRHKADLNDGDLDGVLGYEWMNYEGDDRRSSYVAYVKAEERPNLVVETGARVHRIRFDGRRVTGVEYERGDGSRTEAAADEVVLCAGALESPKLLMLSGIGPGQQLRGHDIPVVAEAAAVGENFHDHPNVTLFFAGRDAVDCHYPQLYGFHRANPTSALPIGQSDTCYVFYPARSSLKEAAQRLLPTMLLPPSLYSKRAAKQLVRRAIDAAFVPRATRHFVERVYGIVVILGKPVSRGTVRLSSTDPARSLTIDPGYFAAEQDLDTMVEGVRTAQRIAKAPALVEWGNRSLAPSPHRRTRAQIADWVRANVMTTYHYAGTCHLGTNGRSVVDTRLRVRGVTGLRVADASVIPTTPVSAMNAPSMLVGLRAARYIAEETAERSCR